MMLPEVPATRNTPDLLYWPMDGYPHSSGGLLDRSQGEGGDPEGQGH